MPERARDPAEQRQAQRALIVALRRMEPAQRQQFVAALPREDRQLVERAMAHLQAAGWRAHPLAMAVHLEPERWQPFRYATVLSKALAGAFTGAADPRQIWNIPSQYGKTSLIGLWGVVWALDYDPTLRLMFVTYDDNKAKGVAGDCRDLVDKHRDQLRFRLRPDRRARGEWRTDQGGGLYGVGVNGAITGYPADAILADDLMKGWEEAHSETQREHTWAIWRTQVRLRVQSGADPIIVAGTRWHDDDPTGKLLRAADADPTADQWQHLRMPAIAEPHDPTNADPSLRAPDPLDRELGEVLEPLRFDAPEVHARAVGMGSYLAAALEQQRPAPEEGNIVKRAWFRLESQLPASADQWLSSWDMKLKDTEQGDFVVGQVWARVGAELWLCDQLRGQWGEEMTAVAMALLQVRWPQVRAHHVEFTGNAPEVMKALRYPISDWELDPELGDRLAMTPAERDAVTELRRRGLPGLLRSTPEGSKAVRMRAQVPYLEAGNVHVLATASWLDGYLAEMAMFPNGRYDDQVDATSQAIGKLVSGPATATGPPQGALPVARQSAGGPAAGRLGRAGLSSSPLLPRRGGPGIRPR